MPSALEALLRAKPQEVRSISSIETVSPTTGESTMAKVVFETPAHTMAFGPAWASPAPSSPPISAWLEEEGMPFHQVMTFHTIAPASAPNTTCGVTTSLLMMPLPTVSATFSPKVQ